MLVYDITKQETFDDLPKWMKMIDKVMGPFYNLSSFFCSCDELSFTLCVFFPQYASEEAELLLVGNKLDCEVDRIISRQQGERVRHHSNMISQCDQTNLIQILPFSLCISLCAFYRATFIFLQFSFRRTHSVAFFFSCSSPRESVECATAKQVPRTTSMLMKSF